MNGWIRIRQASVVGLQQIIAFVFLYMGRELLEGVGKETTDAVEPEPHLMRAAKKDTMQPKRKAPRRVGDGIGQRQVAPPGSTSHHPGIDSQIHANPLDVSDQGVGVVPAQLCGGRRPATATLIEQNNSVLCRIKGSALRGFGRCAGSPVQEYHWYSLGISRFLDIKDMWWIHGKVMNLIGLNR